MGYSRISIFSKNEKDITEIKSKAKAEGQTVSDFMIRMCLAGICDIDIVLMRRKIRNLENKIKSCYAVLDELRSSVDELKSVAGA